MYNYDRRQAARPIPVDKNEVRKLVERALKAISKHLKPRDHTAPLKESVGASWKLPIGRYSTTDVKGQPVEVEVWLGVGRGVKGPRHWISGGTVQAEHATEKDYGQKVRMLINLNQDRSAKDLLEHLPDVSKELYSVVVHEVTHLRDLMPYQEKGDYHNKPTEVRAFMRQVVEEVLSEVHEAGADDGGWLFTGTGPSSYFIDEYVGKSPTWERVQSFLTPRNQRLVLQGVTRAVQDEWSKLQEMYPEEDDDDWDPSKEPLPLP